MSYRVVAPLLLAFIVSPFPILWVSGSVGAYATALTVLASTWLLTTALAGIVTLRENRRTYMIIIGLTWISLLVIVIACQFLPTKISPRDYGVVKTTQLFDPAPHDPERLIDLTFTLNADGWRSQLDYHAHRNAPGNILLFGDSFVFGVVNDDHTVDAIFNRTLEADSGIRMLNLGVSGTGLTEYRIRAEHLKDYRADWVLLGIYIWNDFPVWETRLKRTLSRIRLINILTRNIYPLLAPKFAGSAEKEVFSRRVENGHISPFVAQSIPLIGNSYAEKIANKIENESHYISEILRIREIFRESRFCVVIFPAKYQVTDRYYEYLRSMGYKGERIINHGPQKRLSDALKSMDVCALDLTPALQEAEKTKNTFYSIDPHMNKSGNRVAADRIHEMIRNASAER